MPCSDACNVAPLNRAVSAAQKIPVPLNGDMAAVSKYANEIESLKKKVCARIRERLPAPHHLAGSHAAGLPCLCFAQLMHNLTRRQSCSLWYWWGRVTLTD